MRRLPFSLSYWRWRWAMLFARRWVDVDGNYFYLYKYGERTALCIRRWVDGREYAAEQELFYYNSSSLAPITKNVLRGKPDILAWAEKLLREKMCSRLMADGLIPWDGRKLVKQAADGSLEFIVPKPYSKTFEA